MSNRSGFTAYEMLVAIAVFAVLAALASPRIENLFAHTSVKSARLAAAAQFRLARTAATQGSRTAIVRVNGGRIWVEARPRVTAVAGSTVDTVGTISALNTEHKVTVSATFDSVVYDPRGLGTSGGTLVVSRGGFRDSLLVNAMGLVSR